MHPNVIRSSAEASLTLLEAKGQDSSSTSPARVASEVLRLRVVVVGLALQGFQTKDGYIVLSDRQAHTLQHYRGWFQSVLGACAESAKVVGQIRAQLGGDPYGRLRPRREGYRSEESLRGLVAQAQRKA